MLRIEDYIPGLFDAFPFLPRDIPPWDLLARLPDLLAALDDSSALPGHFIHPGAVIEQGAVIKPPVLIGDGCFIAAHAYLRGGVALGNGVRVGPGVEIKSSIVASGTGLAHFNFIGDSLIGRNVNIEAGAVIANHWNERANQTIAVTIDGRHVATGAMKFGALIGDYCRIGANAVLAPGTLLRPATIVGRLQLIDQSGG